MLGFGDIAAGATVTNLITEAGLEAIPPGRPAKTKRGRALAVLLSLVLALSLLLQ